MLRRFTTIFRILVLLVLLVSARAHAQHATTSPAFDAALSDAKRLQLAPGLKLDVWAAEPQLSNSVAFAFDGKGRVYLAESDRWAISVFDITAHTNWLWQDMSFRSVADRGAFLTNQFITNLAFLTKDSEIVRRVEDRDGHGKADHSEILATGFTNAVDGTAAGVLATREGIYFANIPGLWLLNGTGVISRSVISNQSVAKPPSTDSLNTRSLLASGFGIHIGVSGHDLHGLIKGPDGRIYMSFGDRGCVLTNREGIVINLPDTGGVLRCEPDGRDLAVFCYGLRNPQELAFDDFGNLWTVDNDTAGADPCRVLHLVEGGDYGWRTSYQHMDGFGPWVQEELWKGGQDGILPPAGTVSQGPSGFAFYPGTGFGERLTGTFLHCDFPGGVWAYTVKPQGASYVVDRKEKFLWNCWPTDVDFGPDGAAYVLDWVSGWGQTPRGRIYRITPNDAAADVRRLTSKSEAGSGKLEVELVAQVKQLLADGMTQRGERELLDLLGHADRRVRLEAQWEFAARASDDSMNSESLSALTQATLESRRELQRLHAVWTLAQIRRQNGARNRDHSAKVLGLAPALLDDSPVVARHAALALAEAGFVRFVPRFAQLAASENPVVTEFAVRALACLGDRQPLRLDPPPRLTETVAKVPAWLGRRVWQWKVEDIREETGMEGFSPATVLEASASPDPFVHEAVVQWIVARLRAAQMPRGYEWQPATRTFGRSANVMSRLAAAHALARRRSPCVTNFLSDPDPRLIVAAGRAIHDVPIVEGFPALAAFVTKIDCPTNLMSRVINACYRLGTQQHAQMLAGFAAREDVPDAARVLALRALSDWEKPSPLDRVNGLWRPLISRARVENTKTGKQQNETVPSSRLPVLSSSKNSQATVAQSSAPVPVDTTAAQPAAPSPGRDGRGEDGQSPRSAIPTNPLLERAAQAQAARNLGRAAEIPVLPADLGRSVPYDEAMALRRNPAPAQRAFLRVAGDLMNPFNLNEAGQPAGTREVLPLQVTVAEAAAKLRVKEAGTPLFEKFAHTNTAPELRRAILPALAELRSPLTGDAVKLALADPDPKLRAAALPFLDRLEGDSVDLLVSLIGASPALRDDIPLAQSALVALTKLPGAKVDATIRGALAQLEAKQLPAALALDMIEAARVRGISAIKPEPADMLVGGNAERGRQVFFQNQTVQCLRCHKVGADGGIVGPGLSGIGKRQSREYLLESILQPNAKIAAGFENVVLTLNDGSTVAGALKAEADAELAVEVTGEDGFPVVTKVAKVAVKQRERGPSAMPEGLGDQFTPFELRDLVEYLATLN